MQRAAQAEAEGDADMEEDEASEGSSGSEESEEEDVQNGVADMEDAAEPDADPILQLLQHPRSSVTKQAPPWPGADINSALHAVLIDAYQGLFRATRA